MAVMMAIKYVFRKTFLKTIVTFCIMAAVSWEFFRFIHQQAKMDQALSVVHRDLETVTQNVLKNKEYVSNKKTYSYNKEKRIVKPGNLEVKDKITPRDKEKPFKEFRYPLNVDMVSLVENYKKRGKVQPKPINFYPFKFIKSQDAKCVIKQRHLKNKGIFLLLIVKSAVNNISKRNTIRETWGNDTFLMKHRVRKIFILGKSTNKKLQPAINRESAKFKDIVQLDFIDSYFNNTLKTIGGINWVTRFCAESKFVMMLDDDFFVAIRKVVIYLQNLPQPSIKNLFMGKLWHDRPQRARSKKWNISVKEYPYNKYPPFISAGAMLMSSHFVQKLQIAIQYTKKFKFDDVYLGIVAYKLKVTPQLNPSIHVKKVGYYDPRFMHVLASHGYGNTTEMRNAWSMHLKLTKMGLKKAKLFYEKLDQE